MNAVCGVYERHPGADAREERTLDPMLAALRDHGYGHDSGRNARWTDGPIGLGVRHAGGTPTGLRVDARAGIAVAAAARLDDRATLGRVLGISGAQRDDMDDTAFIGRAYERWGRECPRHLLGDYALVVWDAARRLLFCARDHAGAQPFYYCLTPRRFVFASDVRGVLAAPGVPEDLADPVVAAKLVSPSEGRDTDGTLFRSILKLRSGHALAVGPGAAHLVRWWSPELTPAVRFAGDDEYAEAFRGLYVQAVRDRLRNAPRVGVHLSGGLDSSSVAVLAARELGRAGRPSPPAFSWLPRPDRRPRPASADAEYSLIEAVRAQEGLRVFHQSPAPSDVFAVLRRDIARSPGSGTLLNEAAVQGRAAEQGVRVLLSGWGGDEGVSFNGRGYSAWLLRSGRIARLWRENRHRRANALPDVLAHAVLPFLSPRAVMIMRQIRQRRWRFRSFIHPGFARRVRRIPETSFLPASVRHAQLHLLQDGHLAERIEGWAASGARHGIEYRYPLLDRRLLEFALGLPPDQYRRGGRSRWLMRHALQPILPREVRRHRSKLEPFRAAAVLDAIATALPAIHRAIAAREGPLSRAAYLDMPRLLTHLDAGRFRANRRLRPIRVALELLDW